MASRHSFPGTREQYIEYLENELSTLRRHHATCAARSDQSLATASVTPRSSGLQAQKHSDGDGACNIIIWKPDTVDTVPQREPEWRSQARKLLKETPKGESWWQAIEKAGLYDIMSEGKAATFLLDDSCSPAILAQAFGSRPRANAHCRISQRLRSYALSAMRRNTSATMALKLTNFQEFLVLSACAVLRTTGQVCMDIVADVVKICTGCKTLRYTKRILDTVMWMNKLVDALNVKGWNNRAPELLLLWNHKPGFYYNLSCSPKSESFLLDALSKSQFRVGEEAKWTPLFIPTLISQIFQGEISAALISESLGYEHASVLAQNPWQTCV